jgi:predicted GNAT superfamily acetyltransferase
MNWREPDERLTRVKSEAKEISVLSQALEASNSAQESAGLQIKNMYDLGDLGRVSNLLSSIWATPDPMVTAETMKAMTHAGNYVSGAFQDDELVGGLIAFLGIEDDGEVILHSHILGVSPDTQSRNVGFTLKQHQRAWALERGIETMHWTFDPLVSRNAYFNISKLGARVSAYYPSFYGVMMDGFNAGDETDRVLVEWELSSNRAVSASIGSPRPETDLESLTKEGAVTILADRDGRPTLVEGKGDVLVCRVPTDILRIREKDLHLALEWRKALRSTLGKALDDGYVVDRFSKAGAYVLTRT